MFDLWALKQEQTPSKWYGIKFFNVFGPFEYHKDDMRSVVHKSYGQIKKNGVVRLFKSHKDGFKDGEQLRDFIYGVDAARACVEMLINGDGQKSGIYNLGTGKARSFKDLVTATFKSMGAPVNIEYFDMPEHIRNQYLYFTEAKMDKFFNLLPNLIFLLRKVRDYIKNYL